MAVAESAAFRLDADDEAAAAAAAPLLLFADVGGVVFEFIAPRPPPAALGEGEPDALAPLDCDLLQLETFFEKLLKKKSK